MEKEENGAFWAQLMSMRDPAWTEPTEAQHDELTDQVYEVARTMGAKLWIRAEEIAALQAEDSKMAAEMAAWSDETADRRLATLRALREIKTIAEDLGAEMAREAGMKGAGYPQLGAAWGITRQAARLRWPNAVSSTQASERVPLEMFGGEASVSWHATEGGWWWIATGADGTHGDAGEDVTYDTQAEAAAHAGVFLQQHALPTNGEPK